MPWLVEPRFYAEEATYFIPNIQGHGFLQALTLLHRRGYYQLPINLLIFLVTRFDMRLWPYLTEALAFLVQLFVVLTPFAFARGDHPNARNRTVLSLAFAVIVPNAETWLTLTCIHFLLAVPVFFLLVENEDTRDPRSRVWSHGYLALACLSGPPACLYGPAFALKWAFRRTCRSLLQALIVNGLALIQVVLMVLHGEPNAGQSLPTDAARHLWDLVTELPVVWLGQPLVLPFLGFSAFYRYGNAVAGHIAAASVATTVVLMALLGVAWRRDRRIGERLLMVVVFAATYLFVVMAQKDVTYRGLLQYPIAGERYMMVLACVTVAALHLLANRVPASVWRTALQTVCLAAVTVVGGAYALAGRKQFPGPNRAHEMAAAGRNERPCGLIVPGPEPLIMQVDPGLLERTIIARLRDAGYLFGPADSLDEPAAREAVRRYKSEVLGRSAPGPVVGDGMIETLCGYDRLLAPYRAGR